MIWFFERGDELLRVETIGNPAAGEYILVVHRPGEPSRQETFTSEEAFQARLNALQAQLGSESWKLNEAVILDQSPGSALALSHAASCPIHGHGDAMHVGEAGRALAIAEKYGERLLRLRLAYRRARTLAMR